ncbi:hypothetical protein KUV41_10800 [Halomonas sp. DP8Y7-1]|uniref:hypothetical protein n=1 Tax=Halomonas sp. DP8Y7-1 TaxID=2859078 RepID=UPI001C94D145|nr:hypothetical protein [Halomonas sp. DP8Y7-1]MBY6029846.1 hypothetical protein [Halomonas sp. DP8Y7-1]
MNFVDDDDVAEFEKYALVGITVGVGSFVLTFENDNSIVMSCRFEATINGCGFGGHGEEPETSSLLFSLLNSNVASSSLLSDGSIVSLFSGGDKLKIIPEPNGLESFVMLTKRGISPMITG